MEGVFDLMKEITKIKVIRHDKPVSKEIELWYEKVEKYTGKNEKEYFFEIDKDTDIYEELIQFDEDIDEIPALIFDEKVFFTQEELKEVVGYMIHPKKVYYARYDSSPLVYDVCEKCFEPTEQKNDFVFPLSSQLRKWNHRMMIFSYDDGGELFLTLPLYQHLLEQGIDEKNFRKVENEKGKIIAYQIIGTNRLEKEAYVDSGSIVIGECPYCHIFSMEEEGDYYYQKNILIRIK